MAKSKVTNSSSLKGKKLINFFMPALASGAILLLLAGIIFYTWGFKKPLNDQARYYLQSSVDEKALLVSQKIERVQSGITKQIKSSSNSKQLIEKLKSSYPEIKTIQLFSADDLNVDMEANPAITHATVDIMKQALSGKDVEPELILKDGVPEYVAFVASNQSETEQSVLLITSDPKFYASFMGAVKGPIELQLLQHHNEGNHMIASSNTNQVSSGEPITQSNKFGANWSVAVYENAGAFSPNLSLPLILLLASIAALIISALLPYFTLQKTLKGEARSFIQGIANNKLPSNYKLDFFNELAASYRRVHLTDEEVLVDSSSDSETDSDKQIVDNSAEDTIERMDVDLISVAENISPEIFREYDIRGIAGKNLNDEVVYALGRSIGSEAYARGEQKILVARDGRISSPRLHKALIQGLISSGRDVINLGMVPTPVLYFATQAMNVRSGVMLTGSHNPAKHNGLKVVLSNETLYGRDITGLYKRIKDNDLLSGRGQLKELDFEQSYLEKVVSNIELAKPLKVAVDCGNGVTGNLVPRLLQAIGCEVIALHTEIDGHFPNHHPDPNKAVNLQDLINMVRKEQADVGIAFDGDGDRLGVVDSSGKIIWTDRVMMLFAADVLSRNTGAEILFDVKCSRYLADIIRQNNGVPIMWKTGHSLMKAKMRETGALLGGEGSGHIYFKERWNGFDDAIYAAVRLLELLASDSRSSQAVFDGFPEGLVSEEINVPIPDKVKFKLIEALSTKVTFDGAKINTIDGIRAEYDQGWFLVRASNTTASIVVKFEADNEIAMERLKSILKAQLGVIAPKLKVSF